ncbi:S1 family peptidase [Streptosporangium sp. NPDC048865]|uniref:S1 family peptidase n=1 Tax=Streptosporangium sp. NPDC048865 TaxID=3155766 RepID=UPI00342FD0FD
MPRRHVLATNCLLGAAALALAATPTLAQPRTEAEAAVVRPPTEEEASATSFFRNPPPQLVEALQRDLSLSRSQALTRLANEERLTPVEQELRHKLGSRFGGSWFAGNISHVLVVATTDPADIPMITEAGARPEVVHRSLAELEAIKARVDTTLPRDAGEAKKGKVRYVGVRTNDVIVLSADPVDTQASLEASGVDPVAVRVVSSTEAPKPLFDLVGGEPYYVGKTGRCSVGFPAFKGTQKGFITAGHCGKTGQVTIGSNRAPQGVFADSSFPGNDYAWVSVNAEWTPKPLVSNGTGGVVNIRGAEPAIEGAAVCRSGYTTGWHCGTVLQRNASVTYPQGTVLEVVRTSVCAEPGDSGGSFIAIDQAQGVTSGGSGDCASGGITYFQPIGEILTAYGLTLATTTTTPIYTGVCTTYPNVFTGALNSSQSAYHPEKGYRTTVTGLHTGCLHSDPGAQDALYLQKWDGRTWQTVASAEDVVADEKISYTGAPGTYRYRVFASGGSGPYTLGYRTP